MLDLGTKSLDMDIDETSICRMSVIPDFSQQLFPGEYSPWFLGKRHKKIEFESCEWDSSSCSRHQMLDEIDGQISERQMPGEIARVTP